MISPFPGMDPYLEHAGVWADVHRTLVSEVGAELNRILPDPYFAISQYRYELDHFARDERTTPAQSAQITGVGMGSDRDGPPESVAVLECPRREVSPSVEMEIRSDPIRRAFVEIREAKAPRRLITVIEVLSPENKQPGPGRDGYAARQREVLDSSANLIEIDLLRGGRRVLPGPSLGLEIDRLEPRPDYLVLVSRAWRRGGAFWGYSLYPLGLREWLPCIGVPLKRDDEEVPLDLQYMIQRVYETGPYRRGYLDYRQPPVPPLSGEDAEWAEGLLRGMR